MKKGTRLIVALVRFAFALPFLIVASISIVAWETIAGVEFYETDDIFADKQ